MTAAQHSPRPGSGLT
ncbi:hypothetical protein E2C01_059493 [Portunus trituberculatus]|uniref:Uncharacterized protein n=1 Tax=Portunus trituberculatus TaxID=210409 RepID=A0A5B7H683_PORTR|nr:hypothetical protein [Portunus trituberculatus]